MKFVANVRMDNIQVLVQIMAWRRPGDKPLSEPMIVYTNAYASLGPSELIGPLGTNISETLIKMLQFSYKKMNLKMAVVFYRPH